MSNDTGTLVQQQTILTAAHCLDLGQVFVVHVGRQTNQRWVAPQLLFVITLSYSSSGSSLSCALITMDTWHGLSIGHAHQHHMPSLRAALVNEQVLIVHLQHVLHLRHTLTFDNTIQCPGQLRTSTRLGSAGNAQKHSFIQIGRGRHSLVI